MDLPIEVALPGKLDIPRNPVGTGGYGHRVELVHRSMRGLISRPDLNVIRAVVRPLDAEHFRAVTNDSVQVEMPGEVRQVAMVLAGRPVSPLLLPWRRKAGEVHHVVRYRQLRRVVSAWPVCIHARTEHAAELVVPLEAGNPVPLV